MQEDLAIMQIDPKSKQYKLTAAAILFPMVSYSQQQVCRIDGIWYRTAVQPDTFFIACSSIEINADRLLVSRSRANLPSLWFIWVYSSKAVWQCFFAWDVCTTFGPIKLNVCLICRGGAWRRKWTSVWMSFTGLSHSISRQVHLFLEECLEYQCLS